MTQRRPPSYVLNSQPATCEMRPQWGSMFGCFAILISVAALTVRAVMAR